jgi:hypothetical protein
MRLLHLVHINKASHSGQRRQFSFTSALQMGQANANSRVSQAGQMRHVDFTGSPQAGQLVCCMLSVMSCPFLNTDKMFS